MKPFNLEEALAGKPVQTRDGKPVKIAGYNPDAIAISLRIIGWVDNVHYGWTENARCLYPNPDANKDLFMAPETKDVWVILLSPIGTGLCTSSYIRYAEQDAKHLENQMIELGHKSYGIHKITIEV